MVKWEVRGDKATYSIDGAAMYFKRESDGSWYAVDKDINFYEAINNYAPEGFNTATWMTLHSPVIVKYNEIKRTWIAQEK